MKYLLVVAGLISLSSSPTPLTQGPPSKAASEATIHAAKNFVLKVKEAYPYPKTSSSMYSRCPSGYQDNVLAENATYELEDGFLNGYVVLYSGCTPKIHVTFRVEDATGKLEAALTSRSKRNHVTSDFQGPKEVLAAVAEKYQLDHQKKPKLKTQPLVPENNDPPKTVSRSR